MFASVDPSLRMTLYVPPQVWAICVASEPRCVFDPSHQVSIECIGHDLRYGVHWRAVRAVLERDVQVMLVVFVRRDPVRCGAMHAQDVRVQSMSELALRIRTVLVIKRGFLQRPGCAAPFAPH